MRLVDETATGDRTEQDASDNHADAALVERRVATVAAVADAAAAVDVEAAVGAAADGATSTVAPDMAVMTVAAATPGAAVVAVAAAAEAAQTVPTAVAVVAVQTRYP